jgi:hypothetical protein
MFRDVLSLFINWVDLLVVGSLPFSFKHRASTRTISEWRLKRAKLVFLSSR